MSSPLPDGFADLEPWIDWAQPTEYLRNRKRWSATMEQSQTFYDIMQQRCADALSYLDQFPLTALDEQQTRLLHLCLALAEVSVTVEMYGEPQPKYVFPIDRFVPVHDNWPLGSAGPAMESKR
ncbi:MAG: hypothetical protein EP321_03015 [Sphingomonadales bacterium]|nr:MAG: hypothetical protein EP345_09365 [Sphingomonadales bacterium]TNF05474.1 MAG: hypothetical protein EP321_03015 [Sphingomonadales bacterium]